MMGASKLVQWLGSGDPPAQLTAHLKSRGLLLNVGGPPNSLPPARLSPTATTSKAESSLTGRRVAVLHADPGAADALAQALRKRGGTVLVLSLDPSALDRVEGFDADAVLVEPADFIGGCWENVRALWTHPRLRWAPVVLTPDEPFAWGAPASDLMCQTIQELGAPYDALLKRAASGGAFEVSLATLGPARTLRALVASGAKLRACFETCAHAIELDFADRRVVGARELDPEEADQPLLGAEALAHVLDVDQAKVSVKSVTSPAATNVMASLDDALAAARQFSRQTPIQTSSAPYIARRAFGSPNRDPIASGRPPTAARVYPLRGAMPPPPAPFQTVGSPGSRVMPSRPTHALDARASSAAALNIDVDLEPSVAAPFPDSIPQELASAVREAAPHDVAATWEPAELNKLLAEPSATRPSLAPSDQSEVRKTRHWPHEAHERLPPVVKKWLAKLPPHARKVSPQTLLIPVLMAVIIALLVRGPGPAPASNTGAKTATRELRVRVRKLAPEPQVSVQEASDEESGDSLDGTKGGVRRASALVSEGHVFRREGKLDRAASSYRDALRAYSGYPRALTGLARLALEQGDGITAVRYARALVRARPQQAASHLLLGDALRVSGNLAAAKSAWKVAARRGDRTAKHRLGVTNDG